MLSRHKFEAFERTRNRIARRLTVSDQFIGVFHESFQGLRWQSAVKTLMVTVSGSHQPFPKMVCHRFLVLRRPLPARFEILLRLR
jgi:hypothetical protein